MRDLFLLNPDVVFLNHGSFGACPAPVFEVYQRWQRELERQPVEFLGRRYDGLLAEARAALAAYLNAVPENLVFMHNTTGGVNVVARSMLENGLLKPGDEILATDHEYGACELAWQYVARKSGTTYIRQPIPLPVTTHTDFVEQFWQGVTPRTRVIFMSHITSPTALTFPVAAICDRARAAGILTVIDGAHVPGQLALNLDSLGADFYTGNLHKWLSAPKGCAFLYARPEHHGWLVPPTISWGYAEDASLIKKFDWQGTQDIAAWLSIPAAIQFQADHDWESVRARCHELAQQARQALADLTGLPSILPDTPDWYTQMIAAPLPECDLAALKIALYDEYCIEIPLMQWNDLKLIRASFQAYNTASDLEALIGALRAQIG